MLVRKTDLCTDAKKYNQIRDGAVHTAYGTTEEGQLICFGKKVLRRRQERLPGGVTTGLILKG